jgi:molybdenum cofactor cytidylyltransferase
MISFVGAGGKTGLMLALAQEMGPRWKRRGVTVTTTTHMRTDEVPARFELVPWSGRKGISRKLKDIRTRGKIPLVYSKEVEEGRIKGIGRKAVEKLAGKRDLVLVEADGALRLPVKRLRGHEPVIPEGPTPALVCIVVGNDALGKKLGKGTCFNHDDVIKKGIADKGAVLEPPLIRRILYEPRGYTDVLPEEHDAVAVVNKVDRKGQVEGARALGRHLYHPRIDNVLLARSLKSKGYGTEVTNQADRVFGVVLAAGTSSRFGRDKLLQTIGKLTIIEHVLERALRCKEFEKVVLVLGHKREDIKHCLRKLEDRDQDRLIFVDNYDYINGMSTSMRAGLDTATALGADAVTFLLGDMPGVRTRLMDMIVKRYRSSCCKLCFPTIGGRRGHPVVIGKDLFDELREVVGDKGAREVVERDLDWSLAIDVGTGIDEGDWSDWYEGGGPMDIDNENDLRDFEKVKRRYGGHWC